MVQLEEVADQDLTQEQPGPIEDYESDDFVDTDSELSTDDESDPSLPLNESFAERITALKDILPPPVRHRISSTTSSLYNASSSTLLWSGKAAWIFATSALFVVVPYAFAWTEDQMYAEQEREQKAREGLGEAVTPGLSAGSSAAAMGFQGSGSGNAL